jgi:hypothetical protein
VRQAVDVSTNSTVFIDLLTLAINTTGGDLEIWFDATNSLTSGNRQTFYKLLVDGVAQDGTSTFTTFSAPVSRTGAIVRKVTGLAAGAHTVKVQWKVDSGTTQIRPVTAPNSESAGLLVNEVSV